MFGEWGGLILQFTVTVVVVLGLIAVVYWLVRRYSSGGLGRIGRGRVPRLAVIDAMAVDGRRRLVLVRRDNVEHLILIGGPSDIVVEQAIQRPRQRPVARPQPAPGQTAEIPPPPTETTNPAENPPIPFPQVRVHQQMVHQPAAHQAAAPASERAFVPPRRAAQPQAQSQPQVTRTEPASAVVQFEAMAEIAPLFPEIPPTEPPFPAEHPVPGPFPTHAESGNGQQPHPDFNSAAPARHSAYQPAARAPSPFATPTPDGEDNTAAKVDDLEREMARLLGEITNKRPS